MRVEEREEEQDDRRRERDKSLLWWRMHGIGLVRSAFVWPMTRCQAGATSVATRLLPKE